MPRKPQRDVRAYRVDATIQEVRAESARLRRESAELDEKLAAMLPGFVVQPKVRRHP